MNMRSKSLAVVTAAAMAVTGLSVPSFAASAVSKPATVTPVDAASVPTTDFSSRRRYYGNNNAAEIFCAKHHIQNRQGNPTWSGLFCVSELILIWVAVTEAASKFKKRRCDERSL